MDIYYQLMGLFLQQQFQTSLEFITPPHTHTHTHTHTRAHTHRYIYIYIQGVNDIDCQKNMGDTSQSTYHKSLIQFCFISYFNFYVLKPDVFSTGTICMFTIISCVAPFR